MLRPAVIFPAKSVDVCPFLIPTSRRSWFHPDLGDVTGIQPITRRNVVYVVQKGNLSIYDTTTDDLQKTQVDIIGQAVDVKQVD